VTYRTHLTRLAALMPLSLCLGVPHASAEAECAAELRRLMQGALEWETPIRSRSVTKMAGQEMVNLGLTDGKAHLTMDAEGNPVSLFIDDRFYTTADRGASWMLMQTYTPEVMAASKADLAAQAENATNIICEYGLELDGKSVNRYAADYVLRATGTPMHGEYWVDSDTAFAWKSLTISDPGGNEIIIEQSAEPAPGETVPDPDG
jgi:hypothetical protein